MEPTKHVIIGNGPAGVVAAETIRKHDRNAQITLIGEEPERPYSRMALPYHLIGDIKEEGTHLRKTATHFDQLNINLVQNRVAKIDPDAKQLNMDSGDSISFDKLLIATGSRPTRPPITGMDLPGVVNCWTLADARKIIAGANKGDKVVLMGAGFIGCIILEALARRGIDLTVVEMENRMVPRMMDERSGNLIKQWCENKGVNVLTSTKVTAVSQSGSSSSNPAPTQSTTTTSAPAKKPGFFARLFGAKAEAPVAEVSAPAPASSSSSPSGKLTVELEGQAPLEVDLLICATGVKANIDLAKDAIDTNQGILVNEYMQTSHPDIFAAGDVAEGRDFSTGEHSVQAIQPTAVDHGYNAAMNMVKGASVAHRGTLNMNVLDTMGLISTSFGAWEGVEGGDSSDVFDQENFRYINLQFKDDVLVGANTLGMTQHVGVLRGLIQNKTHLGEWKEKLMQDPSRVMDAYLAVRVA